MHSEDRRVRVYAREMSEFPLKYKFSLSDKENGKIGKRLRGAWKTLTLPPYI